MTHHKPRVTSRELLLPPPEGGSRRPEGGCWMGGREWGVRGRRATIRRWAFGFRSAKTPSPPLGGLAYVLNVSWEDWPVGLGGMGRRIYGPRATSYKLPFRATGRTTGLECLLSRQPASLQLPNLLIRSISAAALTFHQSEGVRERSLRSPRCAPSQPPTMLAMVSVS